MGMTIHIIIIISNKIIFTSSFNISAIATKY